MSCCCSIIPHDVLRRLSQDATLSNEAREVFNRTAAIDDALRRMRHQALALTRVAHSVAPTLQAVAAAPAVTVYDCHHTHTLPGTPVPHPDTANDQSAERAAKEAAAVAEFYREIFRRNSIDDAGMTIMSSIHYGVKYNNAMWNGSQMLYGDGDSRIFTDFTQGNDVIGHELTHGVTQHTLQLDYEDEAGGLNESLSDVFGSMFRQWQANQDVNAADWLIGHDIVGPASQEKGLTCLRDMANPAAQHCIAPQPANYSEYRPGMDPHYSSGIPNLAFCLFAKAVGSPQFPNKTPDYAFSWRIAGQLWYYAMTNGGPAPSMTFRQFADRTHAAAAHLFAGNSAIDNALKTAWTNVGV